MSWIPALPLGVIIGLFIAWLFSNPTTTADMARKNRRITELMGTYRQRAKGFAKCKSPINDRLGNEYLTILDEMGSHLL